VALEPKRLAARARRSVQAARTEDRLGFGVIMPPSYQLVLHEKVAVGFDLVLTRRKVSVL
jgi:hypothetical protein